jgi:hypothetical protein
MFIYFLFLCFCFCVKVAIVAAGAIAAVGVGLGYLLGKSEQMETCETNETKSKNRKTESQYVTYRHEHEEIKSNDIDDEAICKICYDAPLDCVLVPCRHQCTCIKCGDALDYCPICRTEIEEVIRVYRA